jgi:hypothetical protein
MGRYPADMDAECILICDALNALPGIQTVESCCGHGERPHRIFFSAVLIEHLRPVLMASHSSGWHVEARWANGGDAIYFLLEGPIGPANMPGGANDFAEWITNRMER